MYALDSDTISHFLNGSNSRIVQKMLSDPSSEIWLPIIVAEELLRGRLKFIASLSAANPNHGAKFTEGYFYLGKTIEDLAAFGILPYTADAEELFQNWSPSEKRLGTRDCRIAAIAIVYGFTVVTCNTSHFQAIPGIKLEDWSQEANS